MSIKKRTPVHQRGNPIANNPLMRKGGVHKKSRTAKRQKNKRETRRLVANYMGRSARGRGGGRYFATQRTNAKKTQSNNGSKRHEVLINFMLFLYPKIINERVAPPALCPLY
jgi:hypothetical protein